MKTIVENSRCLKHHPPLGLSRIIINLQLAKANLILEAAATYFHGINNNIATVSGSNLKENGIDRKGDTLVGVSVMRQLFVWYRSFPSKLFASTYASCPESQSTTSQCKQPWPNPLTVARKTKISSIS